MKSIVFGLGVLACCTSCAPKVYQALDWQAVPVIADGRISEWKLPLRYYDDKSRINYAINNDGSNMYICMKIVDRMTQRKVMQGGVEVRIDTVGGKKYPISFSYPMSRPMGMPRQDFNPQMQPEPLMNDNPDKQNFSKGGSSAAVEGFYTIADGEINVKNNTCGISAAFDVDKTGTMYYEVVIPFRNFMKDPIQRDGTPRILGILLKVNGIEQPSGREGGGGDAFSDGEMIRGDRMHGGRSGSARPEGGMAPGGMPPSGMPRGGMPQGEMQEGTQNRASMRTSYKVEVKAALAVQ